jgi:hypothetical protein
VKVNCQQYEQFRGFIEHVNSDFVLIIEEVLKASTGVSKKPCGRLRRSATSWVCFVLARKKKVEMLFQEGKEA